jgi:hypothetical protein
MEPHDGDVSIPVAHSSQGYVFLSNLPSTGSFEFNNSGSFWRHDAVLQVLEHSLSLFALNCLP